MSKEIKILGFEGGMTDNERKIFTNKNLYIENFDLGNYPFKLKPQYAFSENTGGFDKTWQIKQILLTTTGILQGLGKDGSGFPQIFSMSSPFSGSGSWTAGGAAASGVLGSTQKLFTEYKAYMYNFHGNNMIGRASIVSNPSYAVFGTTSNNYTNVTDGIIGKDDNLYFAASGTVSNLIRIDGTNIVEPAFGSTSFPSDFTPKQLVKYGNLLGIVGYRNQRSVMYLWDYSSSDITEAVDLGIGYAKAAENIGGSIVIFVESADGTKIRMVSYSGGSPITLDTIKAPVNTYSTPQRTLSITSTAKVFDDQIYVGIKFSAPNSSRFVEAGILRFGRLDANYPYSYSIAQTFLTSETTQGGITSFVFSDTAVNTGLVAAIEESGNNGIYFEQSAFAYGGENSSIYTQIFTGDDPSTEKKLKAFSIYTEALTSGKSVSVYYRKNGDTAWTLMFTDSTIGDVGHDCVNIESNGTNLPTFNEIQFKLVSSNGAIITGFKFKFDWLNDVYGK